MSPVKPSSNEDEYFAREEIEKKRRRTLEEIEKLAEAERQAMQKLHYMHCPKCGMQLEEIALRGVLVDKCFNCHGVWLDNGELEKLAGEDGYWSRMLHFFARTDYKDDPNA